MVSFSDRMPDSDEPSTILIVDDDEAVCEVLSTYLRPKGYRIRTAHTGRSALEWLRGSVPDVTILDLRLQDMSGRDIQRHIRERGLETEVIIITGFASLDSALEAIKFGAFDYIVKPFKLGEIDISVRNALERLHLKKQNRILQDKVRELTARLEKQPAAAWSPTIRFDEGGVPARPAAPRPATPLGGYGDLHERRTKA